MLQAIETNAARSIQRLSGELDITQLSDFLHIPVLGKSIQSIRITSCITKMSQNLCYPNMYIYILKVFIGQTREQ